MVRTVGSEGIRVVIADDHAVFCEGLAQLLEAESTIDFLGSAGTGGGLLSLIEECDPDVAVMDVSMPGPGAVELASEIGRRHPETKLVALTVHSELLVAQHILECGVTGYVIKNDAFQELVVAIETVADGGEFISRDIAAKLERVDADDHGKPLSERERACLIAAARGAMSTQIAHNMGISERTVDFHMANAMRKLDARNRTEAVAKAVTLGLITV